MKSPVETVIGTLRLAGDWTEPKPGFEFIFDEMKHMGQELFNPPSVEGWHTGQEWIDGGTLVHRINFTADFVGDLQQPGIREIVDRLADVGPVISPQQMVDDTCRLLGHYELADETRQMMAASLEKGGTIHTDTEEFGMRVSELLQMIVATKEYIYA